MATSCLPSRHIVNTPPITVVKVSRPATDRPSIGTAVGDQPEDGASECERQRPISANPTLCRHSGA
jgi:hypothetical protein